ncbi:MAG: hypothetical protein Q4C45_08195 [Oscillospiraceae bacterium]|nr:hypothetical protein [Oscillospiraceae bacterium]
MNVFLLGSLAVRDQAELASRRRTEEQLIALFAADGMTLDRGAISAETPPAGRTLERDSALEQRAAAFLLGSEVSASDQGGGIYAYSGAAGTALFRSNGSFDADLGAGGTLDADDIAAFCRKFSYGEPVFQVDEDGSGTAVAIQRFGDLPVFNSIVVFTFQSGRLAKVSGTLLPESSAVSPADREPLSAAAALTAFQKMRRESGAVVSAVTDLYPCYELQSSTAVSMSLVPAWCVVTDTAKYYVNCITGTVSFG